MQGNWTLLDSLHSDHIPDGKFIPIFPRWNLKASSEAYVISFRCTTKLKLKKCPGYQRSSDLAAFNLVHRWISLKIWERHNENSKSQQRVSGIDHLLLLADVLHCLISGPSHVKFSLCCQQPKKKYIYNTGLVQLPWFNKFVCSDIFVFSKNFCSPITFHQEEWNNNEGAGFFLFYVQQIHFHK